MAVEQLGLLPWILLFSLLPVPFSAHRSPDRAVIRVEGGPASVVWVVQLSDLHFSVFHPKRALDFSKLVGPALSFINPSLVLITGDLTDGKSKDLLTMKQDEAEWIQYHNVITDIIKKSGLDEKIFYDLRGNHDCFGVPKADGTYGFYQKYSINARLGRHGNVHSVTLEDSEWRHLFVGFDSTMEIGLRGPTNLFGHPTDQLLADIDTELSQWDDKTIKTQVTKISFGHFPLSFSALSESGKSLKDVFLKHSLSAYICGHLHTRFGKNLKRHHQSDDGFLPLMKYYQWNIHQGASNNLDVMNCSDKLEPAKEFWEWEMGDWRKSRSMRILASDSGFVSFVDINFKFGSVDTIILPTFPIDSRFMLRISSPRNYQCQSVGTSCYETIRALIFSSTKITSVSAKIYDSRPGNLQLVLDSDMNKLEENGTRGDMYAALWNWRAFADPLPDRYWLQIEAIDIKGRSTSSQLRPFSINGLTAKVSWRWKEFLVMGCQWASMYRPILWSFLAFLLSLLIIPQAFMISSTKQHNYKSLHSTLAGRNVVARLIRDAFWILTELSRMTSIWWGILLYLLYLTVFPWFFGHVFTEHHKLAYMTHKGWVVNVFLNESKQLNLRMADVMVVVIPHLCFVVLPTILVIASMAAEKVTYKSRFMSFSGKKNDDNSEGHWRHSNALWFWGYRWMRTLLLLACLIILWKHWKSCRALVKAYDMNPFIHAPVYCFFVPAILLYSIYKTSKIR